MNERKDSIREFVDKHAELADATERRLYGKQKRLSEEEPVSSYYGVLEETNNILNFFTKKLGRVGILSLLFCCVLVGFAAMQGDVDTLRRTANVLGSLLAAIIFAELVLLSKAVINSYSCKDNKDESSKLKNIGLLSLMVLIPSFLFKIRGCSTETLDFIMLLHVCTYFLLVLRHWKYPSV